MAESTEDKSHFSKEEKLKILRAALSIQVLALKNGLNGEERSTLPSRVTGIAQKGVPSNIQKTEKQGNP